MSTHYNLKLSKIGRASYVLLLAPLLCCGCYGPDNRAIGAAGGIGEDDPISELLGNARGVEFQTDPGIDDARLRSLIPSLQGIKVRMLGLPSHGITDNSIATFNQLDSLEYLDIRGTSVTPGGLAELKRLPRLDQIEVDGPLWTKSAIEAAEAKLPGVKIENWDASTQPLLMEQGS